jgi:high affinity Mn2+ porin
VGIFQLSHVPNQIAIEHQPLRQFSAVVEFERRTAFFGAHAGAIKGLISADDGYMGAYADAVDLAADTGTPPNTALVRTTKHMKIGAGINIAQEIAANIGAFARLSAMNGTYEA